MNSIKSIIISFIGNDRPGIVESISRVIVEHEGEWVESHMSNLSGKFVGLLRANLPEQNCDAFSQDLKNKTEGLSITIELVDSAEQQKPEKLYRLELLGQDRSGIVHSISKALANNGATVEEMETEVSEASMSGEKLFKAVITLSLAEGYKIEQLGEVLEDLANELIVDIELG